MAGGVLGKADRMAWLGLCCLAVWCGGAEPICVGPWAARSVFEVMLAAFVPLSLLTICSRVQRIYRRLALAMGGHDAAS